MKFNAENRPTDNSLPQALFGRVAANHDRCLATSCVVAADRARALGSAICECAITPSFADVNSSGCITVPSNFGNRHIKVTSFSVQSLIRLKLNGIIFIQDVYTCVQSVIA